MAMTSSLVDEFRVKAFELLDGATDEQGRRKQARQAHVAVLFIRALGRVVVYGKSRW